MTDWSWNQVTITGEPTTIRTICEFVHRPATPETSETFLSLNALLPELQAAEESDESDLMRAAMWGDNRMPVKQPTVTATEAIFAFDSAGDPPLEISRYLAARWPETVIEHEYEEMNGDYWGYNKFVGGEETVSEEAGYFVDGYDEDEWEEVSDDYPNLTESDFRSWTHETYKRQLAAGLPIDPGDADR